MKIFLFLLITTLCSFAQDFNHFTIDTVKNQKMLIGYCNREAFKDTAFAGWFEESYSNYQPDLEVLSQLKDFLNNINIKIVLATWCGDSKEFFPAFLKILDLIKFPEKSLEIICVDRKKKGFADEVEGLDINFVPTFIFYRDGNEIGRIIELPNITLEADFLEILNQTNWNETKIF